MVELRVDLLKPAERNPGAVRQWWWSWKTENPDLAAVLTIRRTRDLGRWEGDEAQRVFLLEELMEAVRPEYVDLELDRRGIAAWDRITLKVRALGGVVVRSHHEARETPPELPQLMARLAAEPREIPKLAVQMHGPGDLTAMIAAAQEFRQRLPGRKALWIGMGADGMVTRAFPARLGSAWTYGADVEDAGGGDAGVAPGQIDTRTLHDLYRAHRAAADWQLFAVVGNPVAHSRSPEYHNRVFATLDVPALYVPVRIPDGARLREIAHALQLMGISVTVPHKEAALDMARREGTPVSDTLARVGAANTLVRTSEGWRAENTDIPGFLAPLEAHNLAAGAGTRAAVIGAGGAARAVVAALAERSVEVFLFNRTPTRGETLLEGLGLPRERAFPLSALSEHRDPFDLVVQTTPVGMSGDDPAPGYRFRGTEVVYDIIYTPPRTPLLERAAAAGCVTIGGQAMFDTQAELQSRLFLQVIRGAAASR